MKCVFIMKLVKIMIMMLAGLENPDVDIGQESHINHPQGYPTPIYISTMYNALMHHL